MKKGCSLIATIPAMTNLDYVEYVIACHDVSGVRWNSGIVTPYSPFRTIEILDSLVKKYKKKLWVDIKGRQLRVINWTVPLCSCIKINHPVKITGRAKVILRGEQASEIIKSDNNCIYVSPVPKHCVGEGQSLNIIGDDVEIQGYLTESDKEYLESCRILNIPDIMASFVETAQDIAEIKQITPQASVYAKIESRKGVECIDNICGDKHASGLVSARDDLYIELGCPYKMMHALQNIIRKDAHAVCASRIFISLEHSDNPSFSDFEDLEVMYRMGYRQYMLCDNICNYAFDKAVRAWKEFIYESHFK